ncbi:MAG: manganese efflux pump MntP family protein [Clostridiales bacterium]|nr:manganese efflux pump MntP family protein [Clostridiales bacterium]
MGFVEILLIGIGLSMDAFAVSVCKGLKMKKLNLKETAIISIFFGGFQALMPLIGWLLGKQFEKYIINIDHWVAFVLLAFIGGKMIFDSFNDNDNKTDNDVLNIRELFLMAVATSIDALAVGITFAFLQTDILSSVLIIGLSTFALSAAGVYIGFKFGSKYKNKAELSGGIILVIIGVKILLEHLGILSI